MFMKLLRSFSYGNVLENSDALQLICPYKLFGLVTFREQPSQILIIGIAKKHKETKFSLNSVFTYILNTGLHSHNTSYIHIIRSFEGKSYFLYCALEIQNCLNKNYSIFQTTRFNHTMIFFKLMILKKIIVSLKRVV